MWLFEKDCPHQGLFKKARVCVQVFRKWAKKGKDAQKGKTFENLAKIEQNFKIFWKRACDCVRVIIACNKLLERDSCESGLRESVYLIMAKTNISDLSHVHVEILGRDRTADKND